jgi:hypothetical protein
MSQRNSLAQLLYYENYRLRFYTKGACFDTIGSLSGLKICKTRLVVQIITMIILQTEIRPEMHRITRYSTFNV